MLDVAILIIVFLIGFNVKRIFSDKLTAKDNRVLNYLWVYHVLFAIIFYFYVNANGGDARNYWFTVKEATEIGFVDYLTMGFGTYFMYALNYFPSKILDLSFITGSISYALIGYIGFVYFYVLFKERIKYNPKLFNVHLFPAIFFLPNLHFWTSNVGKDTLLFFCIALFFYGMQKPMKHLFIILFAMIIAYLARPHIVFFLVAAFGFGLLIDGNLKGYQKAIFFVIISVAFVLLFEKITLYLRIESFDLDSISNYSNDKVTKLSRAGTGSSIDISSYPFPLKVFTFLYRPLFFDINGALAIIASFENFLLLLISLRFISLNPIKLFLKSDYFFKSVFIFLIMGVVSFSLILGNLGIMLRQKNMFIPALIFLCFWGFSYSTNLKLLKENPEPNL